MRRLLTLALVLVGSVAVATPASASSCTRNIPGTNQASATCTGVAPTQRWQYIAECYPANGPGDYAARGNIVTGDGTSTASCRPGQRAIDGGIINL